VQVQHDGGSKPKACRAAFPRGEKPIFCLLRIGRFRPSPHLPITHPFSPIQDRSMRGRGAWRAGTKRGSLCTWRFTDAFLRTAA